MRPDKEDWFHRSKNKKSEGENNFLSYLAEEADILECPALFKYETKSKNQLSFEAGGYFDLYCQL